jgi:hypothetical protein
MLPSCPRNLSVILSQPGDGGHRDADFPLGLGDVSLCGAKNGMDAEALGRQEAGCFHFLEFARSAKPKGENPQGWPAWMPAVSNSWGFRCAKTPIPKSARMRIL